MDCSICEDLRTMRVEGRKSMFCSLVRKIAIHSSFYFFVLLGLSRNWMMLTNTGEGHMVYSISSNADLFQRHLLDLPSYLGIQRPSQVDT